MFYAGIDWADDHHDVVVIDENGERKGSLRITHNPEGMAKLNTFLHSFVSNPEELACIIETTHGLLIAALLDANWPVYPVNPKTVERKRGPAGAKTDAIDAYLLAKTGRADKADLRRLKPDSALVQELKQLTRDQDKLIEMQTRLVNQLIACLKTYYPVALNLFSKLHQRSTLLFLQSFPTPQQAKAASLEEISEVLKKAGYTRAPEYAPKIRERLQTEQLVADPVTIRTKARLLLALVAQLLPLLQQLAEYDKEITRLFSTHPDSTLFSSLPRAGQRLAPRLLAEIGEDRTRYEHARNLQAVAGTSPVLFESGNYSKAHRRYACIKPLRNVLYQFASQSLQTEAWARQYYKRKRSEGKSHSMALRALCNNWLRIIHALWRKKKIYLSAVFEEAQHAHATHQAA